MVLILCCAVLFAVVASVDGMYNAKISRTVDATTAVLKMRSEVKVKDIDTDTPAGERMYHWCMTAQERETVAFLEVTDSSSDELMVAPADGNCYNIQLKNKKTQILFIYSVHSHMLEPYPATIKQGDQQFVLLELDAKFDSRYDTKKMTTTITLESSVVQSHTKLMPSKHKGDIVKYGPYEDVPAFSSRFVRVHYANNAPFVTFTNVRKEIEISHWGNIAVEELIDLKHTGAKLKGGFSRLDYTRRYDADPSYNVITATIPFSARDIYYRDIIGNISTSDVRVGDEGLQLELQPRFPMMGGWKTQFYMGYNLPTQDYLTVNEVDGTHTLDMEVAPTFDEAVVDHLEARIVLPEGATGIKLDAPYSVEGPELAKRFTFLDSGMGGGRPVVIIKRDQLVAEHMQDFRLTYRFHGRSMMIEPVMLIGAWFLLFCCAIFFNRFELNITNSKDEADTSKAGCDLQTKKNQ